MRAFLSYPYRAEIEPFAQDIKAFLIQQHLEVEDGKWPDATSDLETDIAQKIKGCDVLIVIVVEQHQSKWVEREIGIALGANLYVIQILAGDIKDPSVVTNHYYISRDKGDITLCAALSHTLDCIKVKCRVKSDTSVSLNSPEEEWNSEDWSEDEIRKFYLSRDNFSQKAYGKALREAKQFAAEHPKCWRFEIAKSSALIHLRRFDCARKILKSILKKFANVPRAKSYAYDNMGWLTEEEGAETSLTSEEALSYYKAAKQAEKRSNVYLNLVQCFLELDRVQEAEAEFAEWLKWDPDAIDELRPQINNRGVRFVQAVSKSTLLSALLFSRRRK
jgi:hypothetical protein